MSEIHIADTGLFVAIGTPDNPRYRGIRSIALRQDITFVLPQQVSDELTEHGGSRQPALETAVEEGWASVATDIDDRDPFVSNVMDGVRRYIANADDRREDDVERADTALAGVAAQALSKNATSHAYIYTTDIAAGRAAEAVFEGVGYGDSVTFVNAFSLINDVTN